MPSVNIRVPEGSRVYVWARGPRVRTPAEQAWARAHNAAIDARQRRSDEAKEAKRHAGAIAWIRACAGAMSPGMIVSSRETPFVHALVMECIEFDNDYLGIGVQTRIKYPPLDKPGNEFVTSPAEWKPVSYQLRRNCERSCCKGWNWLGPIARRRHRRDFVPMPKLVGELSLYMRLWYRWRVWRSH